MTARIRLSRAKGFRLPADAVNVARPGRWGNPFVVGRDGTREQCVAMFYQLARGFIDLGNAHVSVDEQLTFYRRVRRHATDLKGHDLACWCALDGKPCHADILLHIANGTPLPDWSKGPIDIGRVRLGMAARDLEALSRKKARKERAAQVGRNGNRQDGETRLGPKDEHAVANGDAPNPSPDITEMMNG